MKKLPSAKETHALVPATQSLPAQSIVTLSEDRVERLGEEFREKLDNSKYRGKLTLQRGLMALNTMNIGVPLLLGTLSGFSVIFAGAGFGCAALAATDLQNRKYKGFNKSHADMQERIRQELEDAQHDLYRSQKEQIVEAAERHLLAGSLLSEADAAVLAALDSDDIADASDELAVTVFQVRQLLAYARHDNEEEVRVKPLTFAGLQLSPNIATNRTYLRERLEKADQYIAEDSYPLPLTVEFEKIEELKPGKLQLVKEALLPFTAKKLNRAFKEAQLPAIPEVTLQGVVPAADFADALEAYERRNSPLDLPAVRGWKGGGQRQIISGPKGL